MFQVYVRKMSSTVKRTDARIVSRKWTALMSVKRKNETLWLTRQKRKTMKNIPKPTKNGSNAALTVT